MAILKKIKKEEETPIPKVQNKNSKQCPKCEGVMIEEGRGPSGVSFRCLQCNNGITTKEV